MPALTPSFLFDFESEMEAITVAEYARMTKDLWWQKVTRVHNSASKRKRIAWLLSTAMIRSQGKGGNIEFDDLVALSTEYVNLNAGAGLKLSRDQLEDTDGNGLDLAGKWSADIGAYMAYWPQKQIVKALLYGENAKALGYDALPFFSASHPVNPFDPGAPTFANLFTGGSSGNYPGALDISEAVSVQQAFVNVQKAIAYIKSIKMPNGEDPRFLRPAFMLVPPALTARAQQITNAKFIAQAVGSAGGSGDVEAIIKNWGFGQPLEIDEFSANSSYTMDNGDTTTGSDSSWYFACEELTQSQLGAMVYVDREPFKITYYTGSGGGTGVDAVLDRARELEWHCQGRNVASYGHPYHLFTMKAA